MTREEFAAPFMLAQVARPGFKVTPDYRAYYFAEVQNLSLEEFAVAIRWCLGDSAYFPEPGAILQHAARMRLGSEPAAALVEEVAADPRGRLSRMAAAGFEMFGGPERWGELADKQREYARSELKRCMEEAVEIAIEFLRCEIQGIKPSRRCAAVESRLGPQSVTEALAIAPPPKPVLAEPGIFMPPGLLDQVVKRLNGGMGDEDAARRFAEMKAQLDESEKTRRDPDEGT